MTKGLKTVIGIVLVLSVTSLGLSIWLLSKYRKTGFVDTVRLVNQYQMKKDLDKEAERKLSVLKSQADSMGALYNIAKSSAVRPDQLKALEQKIGQLNNLLQQAYTQFDQETNEKVWGRLNAAISDYAKENGMQLLIGANGMGTVLYGAAPLDYTDEVVNYVNKKYQYGN